MCNLKVARVQNDQTSDRVCEMSQCDETARGWPGVLNILYSTPVPNYTLALNLCPAVAPPPALTSGTSRGLVMGVSPGLADWAPLPTRSASGTSAMAAPADSGSMHMVAAAATQSSAKSRSGLVRPSMRWGASMAPG